LTKRGIGDLLLDNGQITVEQLQQAQAEQKKSGDSISKILFRLGLADENHIKNALELEYGVNYLSLKRLTPDPSTLLLLSEDSIRKYEAIPVYKEGVRLVLAMVTPSDSNALNEIKSKLVDWQIRTAVCSEDDFLEFVASKFPAPVGALSGQAEVLEKGDKAVDKLTAFGISDSEMGSFEATADAAVRLLSQTIVSNALSKGCTTIHIEPTEKELLVRYRKNGVLLPPRKLPLALLSDLLKTYKTMSSLPETDELPLDGRLKVELDGKPAAVFRLSIVAGAQGEHLVIWLD
jgi:type IV pilus assembly protein PilB